MTVGLGIVFLVDAIGTVRRALTSDPVPPAVAAANRVLGNVGYGTRDDHSVIGPTCPLSPLPSRKHDLPAEAIISESLDVVGGIIKYDCL